MAGGASTSRQAVVIELTANSVGVRLAALPECGTGEAALIFAGAGYWRLAVVAGARLLRSRGTAFAGRDFRVTPA